MRSIRRGTACRMTIMALGDKSFKEGDSVMAQSHNHLSYDEITSENLMTGGMMLGSPVYRYQIMGPYYGNGGLSIYYDDDYRQAGY